MDRARARRWRWIGWLVALAGACMPRPLGVAADPALAIALAPVERTRWPLAAPAPARARWPASIARTGHALPAAGAAEWSRLLAAADDPVPACRLSVLLEDCRLARQVEVMIETEVSMAEREGRGAASVATEILALEATAAEAHAACGRAPPELLAHEWSFLLRAAQAGHEPSMFRFVTDLPTDPAWPEQTRAAHAAWREHAPVILASLVQRRSPEALMLAYRAAQGFAILGDQPLQARDAAAAARLGHALDIVHDDDPALAVELAALAHELEATQHRRARQEGERLAEAFLAAARDGPATAGAECESGWPGMQAGWTAYGYQSGE